MILRQFLHSDPVAASYLSAAADALPQPSSTRSVALPLTSAAAEATGMRIRYVIDTHLHADHVSAGRALAQAADAEYVLFAEAATNFRSAAWDGEVLELGNVQVTVLHTPGHTPSTFRFSSPIERAPTSPGSRSPVTRSWWVISDERSSRRARKKARAPCSAACSA